MSDETNARRTHALVMGASLGGLLTARILSDHFEQVTLVERDPVSHQPESRHGQPHTCHLHGLLPGGLRIMQHYFPDLEQALSASGANVGDFAEMMVWNTHGGYRRPFTMNLTAVTMSRPLLEHLIRERVLALHNVRLIDQHQVRELRISGDRRRITGVTMQPRNGGSLQQIVADLVVDATGRGSHSPQWLRELGYEAPPVSEVQVKVSYATRLFKRNPADARSRSWFLYTPDAPQESHFGAAFPIEGDRWIMSVGGWHGETVPLDDAGFTAFVRSLPMPELYDIARQNEPLSDPRPYRFPASLRRHYEKLKRFPLGYLVLGDAISSFNPTYGQGMTSAAMQVAALDQLLTDKTPDDQLAKRFFGRAAQVIDIPWQLAVGEDFRYAQTVGPKPPGIDLVNRYVSLVQRATHRDKVVCAAFLRVMSLLKPPASLFHPRIVWRVLRDNWFRKAPVPEVVAATRRRSDVVAG